MGRKRRTHFHAHLDECRCGEDVRIICQNGPTRAPMTDDPQQVTCLKCLGFLATGEWERRLFGTT